MGNFVFNVSKGKVNEYVARVAGNDPANSALVIVGINTTETDANLEDLDTLALVLANGNTAELGNTGYSRTVYTDAELSAPSPDDANNRQESDMPDIDWGAITGDDVDFTDIVICYDPDTTSGTDADIVPLVQLDFAVVTDGSSITTEINANGFFRAS